MKLVSVARRERSVKLITLSAAWFLALIVLAASAYSAAPQRTALSSQRNISELADEAGLILRGRVISARVEPHPQFSALLTVLVTLQVDEVIKGKAGASYTFRQFIWDPRDRADAAGYVKGGQLLLFLLSPNSNGLSGPAGLEQGRFQVSSDAAGKLYAANGRNNIGLLSGVAASAATKGKRLTPHAAAVVSRSSVGPIALDDLRDLLQQLGGAN